MNIGDKKFTDYKQSSKGRPPCAGYRMIIRDVKDTKSAAGNNMIVFQLDIEDGEYKYFFAQNPLKLFVAYSDARGKEKLVRYFKCIVDDNKSMFPENVLDTNTFDESRLIGLSCGCVLKFDDKGYLKPWYICSVADALKKTPIRFVAPAAKIEQKPDDMPF